MRPTHKAVYTMDILAYYWLISNQGTTDVATRTEPNPKVNKKLS